MNSEINDQTKIGIGEKLIFRGFVLPLHYRLTLPDTVQELYEMGGGSKLGTLKLIVQRGFLSAIVDVEHSKDVLDIGTWRNSVLLRMEAIVDSVGFVDGGWFAVEIEDVLVSSLNQVHVFDNSLISLKQSFSVDEFHNQCVKVMALTRGERGPYFQRALAELGKSIRYPFDSPVHAYRAIEFILQLYMLNYRYNPKNQKNKAWEKLIEDLDLDPSYIKDKIKIHSDPIRHGELKNFTVEERRDLFNAAWDVVRRFSAKYSDTALIKNGSPLNIES